MHSLHSHENKVLIWLRGVACEYCFNSYWHYHIISLKSITTFCAWFLCTLAMAQPYTSSSIFSHNDYVKPIPFYDAYAHEVGFIEADIFLKGTELLVAHTRLEIRNGRTLDSLYLRPLERQIELNNGSVYNNKEKTLALMIDLKSESVATLHALVEKLKQYPRIITCKNLQVTISGNVPDPSRWHQYPNFIHFDGRPDISYTPDQLSRINLISTSFKNYSAWNGKGVFADEEKLRIAEVINEVHAKGKKVRFWAAPDSTTAWRLLMRLRVDVINTDDVRGLAKFIKETQKGDF